MYVAQVYGYPSPPAIGFLTYLPLVLVATDHTRFSIEK